MGAYSTMEVSREWIIEKVREIIDEIDEMTNEQLEGLAFELLRDKYGANFMVTTERENKHCPYCCSSNIGEKDFHDDMDGRLYCFDCREKFDRWKW